MGQTGCWIELCRRFWPMSMEEARTLDSQDKDRGVAFHQVGFVDADLDKAWRLCSENEMREGLERKECTMEGSDAPTN